MKIKNIKQMDIDLLTKDEIKNKYPNATFKGYIKFRRNNYTGKEISTYSIHDSVTNKSITHDVFENKGYSKTKGYIYDEKNNVYYAVTDNFLLIILILVTVILSIAIGVSVLDGKDNPIIPPIIEDGGIFDGNADVGELTQEEQRIKIYGYSKIVITKGRNIDLVNPKENTVLFKYTILYNDLILHQTDYIKPGQKIGWDAYQDLNQQGNYNLKFKVETIDLKTYEPRNGATMDVIAIVE